MSTEQWGLRPRDWAELAEPSNHRLFETVLELLGVGPGTALIDIGCGSGYALAMAAAAGARVTGIDITPELLEIAAERAPTADLHAGGMDRLPFADSTFDVAVGFNAFMFAEDPTVAVAEATRVIKLGGLVAATAFAEPERNEANALNLALEPLRAGGRHAGAHTPYVLSDPGGLESLFGAAGLEVVDEGELPVIWAHDDVEGAVKAVLASAGGALAIEAAGVKAATDALTTAVVPFTSPDGSVAMRNVFRYAIGRRPG